MESSKTKESHDDKHSLYMYLQLNSYGEDFKFVLKEMIFLKGVCNH